LYCQIDPFFTPTSDAQRNHQIETLHSLGVAACWSRQEFASLAEVPTEVRLFLRWYRPEYQPPALHGKTPAQARPGFRPPALTQPLRSLIPSARRP
jgi:hypothetical protein